MNDVSPISTQPSMIYRVHWSAAPAPQAAAPLLETVDRVEVSRVATLLAQLDELQDVREDVVARVRAQIVSGTYDIDGKIDAILQQVIDDLA